MKNEVENGQHETKTTDSRKIRTHSHAVALKILENVIADAEPMAFPVLLYGKEVKNTEITTKKVKKTKLGWDVKKSWMGKKPKINSQ